MSLWVKICGNTSLEDALLAADAGADAVGFVFAPSARRVTSAQVAAIVAKLPASLEKIGVFVDASLDEIVATAQSAGLTGVQLHFAASPELPGRLRQQLGSQVRILRVVHFGATTADEIAALADDQNLDGLLIDSKTAAAVGGTGVSFDWEASTTLFQNARERKLIAAGGLGPQNVAEAIRALKPWGVDAVSGVEAAPGRKDPAKVRAFIANARAARP